MKLIRDLTMSKEDFLWMLYNKMGCKELAIAHNYKHADGGMGWSKWVLFKDLLEMDERKKNWIISKATHRLILDIEILFDIDDLEMPIGNLTYTFPDIKTKSKYVYKQLIEYGFDPVVYWTGSKSYHMSVLMPEMRGMSKRSREIFKSKWLNMMGADNQKNIDRCMISCEGEKHYKSGKKKTLVEW